MTRVAYHHGALYSQPRKSRKKRRCDGHLADPHWIEKGDPIVWSALPPNDGEIGNTNWWHRQFCIDCAPEVPQ